MNDADIELAEMADLADALHAYQDRYGCVCWHVTGEGAALYCVRCGATWASDEAWYAFHLAVVTGDWEWARGMQARAAHPAYGAPATSVGQR